MPKVLVFTNWVDSRGLYESWKKQSKDGRGRWNDIELVDAGPADIYIIINGRLDTTPEEMILTYPNCKYFLMEPYLPAIYGEWRSPRAYFSRENCLTHDVCSNIGEWHISYTYQQLTGRAALFNGKYDLISTIQSCKDFDDGHRRRLKFIEFLAPRLDELYCFGAYKIPSMKNHKGMLPPGCKERGLERFKYHFAAENNAIDNYFTEKIIDGILCECLVFYWGCPNLEKYLPARAFVRLTLEDFEADAALIRRAIDENWWEQRLPDIRAAKDIILNKLQFFPLIEGILS